jgi:Flp pilus assembly protein CpaB
MLLTRPKSPKAPSSPRGGGGPLSTRGGTLLVAALLSLVAGLALLVFLRQYREDLTSSERVRVLVAASLVPKGTRGEIALEKRMYRMAGIRVEDLKQGAIKDPADLEGRVAKEDIFPGHQLTTEDFEGADETVGSRLTEYQRAITVPVDKAHGMVGKIQEGDRVDVVTTGGVAGDTGGVALIAARGALVLAVPEGSGSGGVTNRTQQVTLRVSDQAAASIAAAADNGKVWLVLRPAVDARAHANEATISGVRDGRPLNADVNIQVRER